MAESTGDDHAGEERDRDVPPVAPGPRGGTAPMSTSRTMPPELAAAKDSTRTPKTSSRCFTAAAAPLSANTKVPPRSSATGSTPRSTG